jgi:AraC family transcriptional regulator
MELLRHHSTIRAPMRADDLPSQRVAWLIDYIEAHVGDDLSLRALAKEAGVSRAHWARQFKTARGRTLHQYVIGRRLECAAALLSSHKDVTNFVVATAGSSTITARRRVSRISGF